MTTIDINAMFAASTEEVLYLDAGSYESPPATVPSGRTLRLHPNAVLSPVAGTVNAFIGLSDKSTIVGGKIDAPAASFPSVVCIYADSKANVSAQDVEITNGGNFGVMFSNCGDARVDNLRVKETNTTGIQLSRCWGARVTRCVVANSHTSHAFQADHGSNNVFDDCTASGAFNFGFSLYCEQYSKVLSSHTYDTRPEGINLDTCLQCSIKDNTVTWYGGTYASIDFGISVNGNTGATASNLNIIMGNNVYGCGKSGIALAGFCSNNVVANNVICDVNRINETQGAGIILYGYSGSSGKDNLIVGNSLQGNAKMKFGINDMTATGNPNRYANNSIVGAVTKWNRASAAF